MPGHLPVHVAANSSGLSGISACACGPSASRPGQPGPSTYGPSTSGPSPTGPSISGPSASGTTPGNLDVNKLLASLAAGGLLSATAPVPAPSSTPSTKPDYTSSIQAMISHLYDPQSLQCQECGIRFASERVEELRQHKDWHFKLKRLGKTKGTAPRSRGWLLPLDEWLKHLPSLDADIEQSSASIFDSSNEASTINVTATHRSKAELPVSRSPFFGIKCMLCLYLPHGRYCIAGSSSSIRCRQAHLLSVWGRSAHVLGG